MIKLGTLDLTVNIIRCSMNVRRYSLNFAPRPTPRGRDGKELIQCPTSSCDGMGHVSGNYATHRRQGSIDIYQAFDVNARLCIYRFGDAARTQARYIHTYIHLNFSSLVPQWSFNRYFYSKIVDDSTSWNTHTHARARTHTHTHTHIYIYNKWHYVNCELHLYGWFLHQCILVVRGVVAS